MAAVRAWHPVRLALVCAVLALAGGGTSARAVYAEVSARAVAVTQSEAAADVARAADEPAATSSPPPIARVVARPITASFVHAPLYLRHCALLL